MNGPAQKRDEGETLNLASLLDALTNVVGILAFIVMLMQVSLADSSNQIVAHSLGNQPDVDPTLKEVAPALGSISKSVVEISKGYPSFDPTRKTDPKAKKTITKEDVERLERKLANIARSPGTYLPSAGDLEKASKIRIQMERISDAQAKLEMAKAVKYAKTAGGNTSKTISLPDPKPVAKTKKPIFFICRNERIYPFNAEALSRQFKRGVQDVLKTPANEAIKIAANDFPKVVEYFQDLDIGDEYTRIKVESLPNVMLLRFDARRSDQGDKEEDLLKVPSALSHRLSEFSAEKHYVKFLVWSDSFRVYLEARKLADKAGFQANWVPYSIDEPFREIIGGGAEEIKRPEMVD